MGLWITQSAIMFIMLNGFGGLWITLVNQIKRLGGGLWITLGGMRIKVIMLNWWERSRTFAHSPRPSRASPFESSSAPFFLLCAPSYCSYSIASLGIKSTSFLPKVAEKLIYFLARFRLTLGGIEAILYITVRH